MRNPYPIHDKDCEKMPQTEPERNRCEKDEGPVNCCAMRQSARGVLEDLIRRKRREADSLDALCRQLPLELSPEADEALWQVLCQHRA